MTDVTTTGSYIVADAVKFTPVASPKSASWDVSVGTTGTYKVYARWPASPTFVTDAQYTVTHAGGSTTVTANQRLNGGKWNLLGTFTFNAGTTYKVTVADNPLGAVAADAIYYVSTAAPTDQFVWTPTFPGAGSYQVFGRWPANSNNTGAASYTVTHAGGTSSVTANQKQNGGTWVPLGTWSFAPASGHKVTLAGSADGTTIADALLFVASGSQPANLLYVHPDHLGSPQKMTDSSQAIAWDAIFDPFGKEVNIAGLADMPKRFPGQYADEETGYSYNYFRDYDPTLGRYLQSDPLGLVADLNPYSYVAGNPLNAVDPTGEYAWLIAMGSGAASGAALDLLMQLSMNGWNFACLDYGELLGSAAIGALLGAAGRAGMIGWELKLGKNFRFAPFGNRTANPYGKWPHYHRRPSGNPPAGQSINRHRPWEPSKFDKTFWDRF
jgi:RHS repeat-associated protein